MENRFGHIAKEKTNEELLTMVYQFEQWDIGMLQAIEDELQNRQILPDDIPERKQQIIDEYTADLEQGKKASLPGQIFGWLGVLGFLGLAIGYNYAYTKSKSKYTGKKYYKYDEDSRDNGTYIFYISLAIFILYFLYKLATLRGN